MKKNFSFTKAYKELENITEEFETKDVSLEDGLKKFEKGLELASECKEYLEKIENKIIEIKKKYK